MPELYVPVFLSGPVTLETVQKASPGVSISVSVPIDGTTEGTEVGLEESKLGGGWPGEGQKC